MLLLLFVRRFLVVLPPATDLQPNVLALPAPHDSPREQELRIFDFNVHPKRVDDPCDVATDQSTERTPWQYYHQYEETVLPQRDLFAHPVKSALPYAVSTLKGVWRYTGFMIDDQRLVGMKVMFYTSARNDPF